MFRLARRPLCLLRPRPIIRWNSTRKVEQDDKAQLGGGAKETTTDPPPSSTPEPAPKELEPGSESEPEPQPELKDQGKLMEASSTEFELPPGEDFQRYYHYFDTHRIYSGLKYSGFNEGQADMLMLTIRDMLSRKLAECKEGHQLVSQADNDAYLFDAACSEIRNEIQTTRQQQNEEYRSNLARLTRDTEILQQEVNEMFNTMKSEIDMEIEERKNVTRAEESSVDMKIQEANNQITIDLSSEVKSKIEALRWQTTRRGLVAVLIIAFGVMTAYSATNKKDKQTPKRKEPVHVVEEYQVPMLSSSEMDDQVEDPVVERLETSR